MPHKESPIKRGVAVKHGDARVGKVDGPLVLVHQTAPSGRTFGRTRYRRSRPAERPYNPTCSFVTSQVGVTVVVLVHQTRPSAFGRTRVSRPAGDALQAKAQVSCSSRRTRRPPSVLNRHFPGVPVLGRVLHAVVVLVFFVGGGPVFPGASQGHCRLVGDRDAAKEGRVVGAPLLAKVSTNGQNEGAVPPKMPTSSAMLSKGPLEYNVHIERH